MPGSADTAKLLASLDLQDAMSPKLKTAMGTVSAAEGKVSSLGGSLGKLASTLKGGLSTAMTTFTGRLKQAAVGLGAILGIGGIAGIGAIIGGSIRKLEDFSLALEKVQTLTGETAQQSGTLILLFEKFGISLDSIGTFAGFAEKTLGKLNQTSAKTTKAAKDATLATLEQRKAEIELHGGKTKTINLLIKERKAYLELHPAISTATQGLTKLQALDKQFGLHLVDAKGKVVNYSEELRQLADFYDRNHDAATRAYVASTLLGRGYAALAPILDQGSAAIREAANEADALGLGSGNTAKQIVDFRNQLRNLGTQANVLQLQIGMALIPTISHFATDLSSFLREHGRDITQFFRSAGQTAEQAAGVIAGLVGRIGDAWNSIPSEFRDLLLKGIVADKTVKFLFGFDPAGAALGAIKKAITTAMAGGIAKGAVTAGLGKLFVQPVFVTNWGGMPGGPGGLPGSGGASWLGNAIALGIIGAGLVEAIREIGNDANNPQLYQQTVGPNRTIPAQFGPRTAGQAAHVQSVLGNSANATAAANANKLGAFIGRLDDDVLVTGHKLLTVAEQIHLAIKTSIGKLDERLKHPLLPHSIVNHQLHAALRIAKSSESTDQKLKDLERINKDLVAGGHKTAHYVQDLINVEKRKKTHFSFHFQMPVLAVGFAPRVYRYSANTQVSDAAFTTQVSKVGSGLTRI